MANQPKKYPTKKSPFSAWEAIQGFIGIAVLWYLFNTYVLSPEPEKPTRTASGTVALDTVATKARLSKPTYEDTPWGSRIFVQRDCDGIDDCIEANIELEQTEASRMMNRIGRASPRRAVELLGPPQYVLRAGDKVPVEYYDNNVTERGFAQAVIMWANGFCAANSIHVRLDRGNVTTSIETGGSECTIEGKPFPMPTDAFSCAKGRKADPFCRLENVLKLLGI